MRGLRRQIRVLEYAKGSCEGEGGKLFSMAGQEVLSLNCSKGNKCRKNFLTSDCQRSGTVEQMVWDGLGVFIVAVLKCGLAKLHFRELNLFSGSGINLTSSPKVPSNAGLGEFMDFDPECREG